MDKIIKKIENVIDDLIMVGPIILKYKKSPIVVSYSNNIPDFYTVQKAKELQEIVKSIQKIESTIKI